MKQFVFTIAALYCFFTTTPLHAQEKMVIAVLPFQGETGSATLDKSGSALAEYLRTELSDFTHFMSADKKELEAASVKATTPLTAKDALIIAKACNARFVVTGSFSGTTNNLCIKTRIYDTTQDRWYTEDVTGSYKKQYHKMVEILAYNIRHALTGSGGYITTYQLRQGWYASMAIASGVTLFTSSVMYALYRDSYDNMYMNPDQSIADIETNYQKANASFRASTFFAWTGLLLTATTGYLLVSSYAQSNFITGTHGIHDMPLSFVPASDGGTLTYTLRF